MAVGMRVPVPVPVAMAMAMAMAMRVPVVVVIVGFSVAWHATIIPMTTFSAAILLFFVMDPIGNIPLFLAARNERPNPT